MKNLEGKDHVSLKASSLSKRLVALIKDIVLVNILIFISSLSDDDLIKEA